MLDQNTVSENSRRQHLLGLRQTTKGRTKGRKIRKLRQKKLRQKKILMQKKIRKLRRAGRR